ncbi:MAG TPA: hypothetical protein VLV16_09385, partial [Gemmatimonadales bacterium]|nr:hypothetical protein [Gemmatimonadales bacterium]
GRLALIEANPRLTGSGDAAPYDGVDVCWLHYLDLIGKGVTPVVARGGDFRHITLREDARVVLAYKRQKRLSWREILRSYRAPRVYYDFDPGDWRYSMRTVYLVIRALLGYFARSVAGRARSPRSVRSI